MIVTGDHFRAPSDRFESNLEDGRTARVIPATLYGPARAEVAGVAFIVNGYPRLVIPAADALRLAHEIADTLS